MKKILKLSTLALAVSLTMTGCIEETFPTGSTATDEMVSESPTALEAMVGAIPVNMAYPYSVFGSGNNYGFDFGYPAMLLATDACTGDLACTEEDNSGYDWFTYWKNGTVLGPTQTVTRYPWGCYYTFIKACNDVIGMIPMADDVEDMTDANRKYLGQAKAFRAQLYLDMARSFDPFKVNYDAYNETQRSKVDGLTVPIVTESTTEEESRNLPRAPRNEMFEFIFSELDDAAELLDGLTITDKTAPTLAVVYGIRARACLWLGQFDKNYYGKAAEYAREAMKESKGRPMTEAEWTDPKTGFNTPNAAWMWYLPQSAEGVTNLVNYVAWMSSEATWGYGSLIFPGTTTKFYGEVKDGDFRKKLMIGPSVTSWYAQNSALTTLSATPGSDTYYQDCLNAYSYIKFRPANGENLTYKVGNATSIPLMRYEEMMLIEAEATAYSDPAEAARLLRAFIETRGGNYSIPSSESGIVDAVLLQKRIELWGEGVVFYDFKRLNKGIETGYEGTNVPADARFATNGRAPWWNFCIPESETQKNLALDGYNNPNPVGIVPTWKK